MNSFLCDDCQHSFYVPGTNLPLVIQGGCPECGGDARPEPDQPSPTAADGDGRVRNLVDPDTGDDTGGNPLQEGILADGGWQNRRVRDESFASVRRSARGLVPCPDCGGDIDITRKWDHSEVWKCAGCGREWPDTDAGLRDLHPKGIPCPKCGSDMHWRDSAGLTALHPEGAWECSNQRCWHMMPPGEQVPDAPPEDWGRASSQDSPRDEYVTPMRTPPQASNQTPSPPWAFEVEEVAEPGMDNEDAEEKIKGHEKKAGPELIPLALGALRAAAPRLLGAAVGQGVGGMMGGGGNASVPPQAAPAEARPMEMIAGDKPGGGTPDEFPKDTEDPEKVDPKEHNDGDTKNWQNDVSVNGMGGTDSPHGDDSPTPGLEALQMLLPLVVHYAESPESALDHPLLAPLHKLLGDEGILNGPDDDQAVIRVIRHVKGEPDEGDATSLPKDEGQDSEQSDDGQDKDVGDRTHEAAIQFPPCPNCGKMDGFEPYPFAKGLLWCNNRACQHIIKPEDLAKLLNDMKATHDAEISSLPEVEHPNGEHTGSSHQGPHSPEQIAAVQQLLMETGRTEEVPNVPMQPWDYADEMAQVAHKPDQPPQDTGAQPQPMQDPAPPEDTMPMPGMEAPPPGQFGQATASRQGSPEYVNLEPNWDGMRRFVLQLARSGDIEHALNVNRELASEALPEDQLYQAAGQDVQAAPMEWSDPHNSAHDHTMIDGGQGVPAADQLQQQDPEADTDSSNQWQTGDGQPLIVGEQYELQTPGVEIPDIVRVKAVRPESVKLEFTGAYELGFSKDITRQEFNTMGYQFAHVRGDEPEAQASEDANNAPDNGNIPDFSGPGSGAGGSDHQVMTKWKVTSRPTACPECGGLPAGDASGAGDLCTCGERAAARQSFMPGAPGGTQPGGQCPQCGGPLQPDGSCAGCERSNLAPGAPGVPPAPAGVQNPNGGPPSTPVPMPMNPGGSNPSRPPQSRPPGAYSSVPTHDPETGQFLDQEARATIARLMRNAASESSSSSAEDEAPVAMAGADDRDWLSDGTGDRTAGAHFSPSEQRALIDEDGKARNADKLDLSHTHYEARRHTTADDFMFGL